MVVFGAVYPSGLFGSRPALAFLADLEPEFPLDFLDQFIAHFVSKTQIGSNLVVKLRVFFWQTVKHFFAKRLNKQLFVFDNKLRLVMVNA